MVDHPSVSELDHYLVGRAYPVEARPVQVIWPLAQGHKMGEGPHRLAKGLGGGAGIGGRSIFQHGAGTVEEQVGHGSERPGMALDSGS